jgi:pilus assembly protein Flp/PilA
MDTAKENTWTIRGFLRDERGATAIEYALIAAGIAVTIVTAVNSLGDSVKAMYETISTAMAG